MKILHLCDRKHWLHKMSRVRFHSVDAIGRRDDVELVKDGPGFELFSTVPDSIRRHEPDVVLWYKPMEMKGWNEAQMCGVPLVLRYNEMYNVQDVADEINQTGTNAVVCHLWNEVVQVAQRVSKEVQWFHIPHCAERTVFRPMDGIEKEYDVMLTGITNKDVYPLRHRFKRLLESDRMKRFRVKIQNHPGYRTRNVDDQVLHYARELNKAKIILTDSSKYRYALAKFIEIGMCECCLFADIPADRPEWYRQWVVECTMSDSTERIVGKIRKLLKERLWEDWAKKAREACKGETQEKYASRFVAAMKKVLEVKHG